MNFYPLVSFGVVGMFHRVVAQLGRVGSWVVGGVQRFALTRWRVARICWRDLVKASAKTARRGESDTTEYFGVWWSQSAESQRTTVRRRAGV